MQARPDDSAQRFCCEAKADATPRGASNGPRWRTATARRLALLDPREPFDMANDLGKVRIGKNIDCNTEGWTRRVEELAAMIENLFEVDTAKTPIGTRQRLESVAHLLRRRCSPVVGWTTAGERTARSVGPKRRKLCADGH